MTARSVIISLPWTLLYILISFYFIYYIHWFKFIEDMSN